MSEFVYKFGKPMNFWVDVGHGCLYYRFKVNFAQYTDYYNASSNVSFNTKDLILGIMNNNWRFIYDKLKLPHDSNEIISISIYDMENPANQIVSKAKVKGVPSMDFVLTD